MAKRTNFWRFLLVLVIFAGFIYSRIYILQHPPELYSDVKHDYERYANIWYYGLPPYLKHYYEYPPATVPLVIFPLWLDQHGVGKYYLNYRLQTFAIDVLLFMIILKVLTRLPTTKVSKLTAVAFYLGAPIIAKDFFYEGIDLAFTAALTIALISLKLFPLNRWRKRIFLWAFFWLSTAIKFVTFPLIVPLVLLRRLSFKRELVALIVGFLLIWGLPLAIFRSSLSVSFVFHAQRPPKYGSLPSYIAEAIGWFTKTEHRVDQPPDWQMAGPVSDKVTQIFSYLFLLSLAAIFVYFAVKIVKPKSVKDLWQKALGFKSLSLSHLDPYTFAVKAGLIFIFTLFLTAKTFSSPFHIWYLPLITIFPFKSHKQQLAFIFLAVWMLVMDTNPWSRTIVDERKIWLDPLPYKFLIYDLRYIPMFLSLFLAFKLPDNLRPSRV